ncbi:NAD-dependent epimerase/dehydratase family protein [Gordonia terrae]
MGDGRVLVTGGTGAFGMATARWLSRAGHDVVLFARHEPRTLPRRAVFHRGDITDLDSVRDAMRGCDVVVHLAWVLSGAATHEAAEPINIGGTENVLKAMQDIGTRRLVFASSVTAYGAHPEHPEPWREHETLAPARGLVYEWHKARAEQIIADSGVDAIRVRPTVVVGRDAHNAPANVYRQVAIPDMGGARIQMVHQDDVGRFFAHACGTKISGPVNLAPADSLTWREIAEIAGRPVLHTPIGPLQTLVRGLARVAPVARSAPELFDLFAHWPLADTTRLTEDFGFVPAFSSREAISDQGRHSRSHIVLGMREIRKPTRLDRACLPDSRDTVPDEDRASVIDQTVAGEFDTVSADPRYPEWTCANLAEAFPGPMTPLSLQLNRDALFASADVVARLLPLPEHIRDSVRTRQLGVFGHRLYHNVSVMREMVTAVPGQTPEDFANQINGTAYPEGFVRPRPTTADIVGYLKFAATAGPRLFGLPKAVEDRERRARELTMVGNSLATLPDPVLIARIEELWAESLLSWQVGNVCTFLVSAPTNLIERRYGAGTIAVAHAGEGADELSSMRLLNGVRRLAIAAQNDGRVRTALESPATAELWSELRQVAPDFADAVGELIVENGHRGPGETELANRVYADAPELLLGAIRGAMNGSGPRTKTEGPTDRFGRALVNFAWKAIANRERARDATTRIGHQLRLALREWGSRLVARGLLERTDDVFYLVFDELFDGSDQLAAVVTTRRHERERLADLSFPVGFEGVLTIGSDEKSLDRDDVLTGVGASTGVVKGRVRILRDAGDDIEPGEILVASVTDTGWTPFFATSAAVVTDIGGMMSHASIVAREFGIPAVVGTLRASTALADGQLVEVDGAAGTVTVLE